MLHSVGRLAYQSLSLTSLLVGAALGITSCDPNPLERTYQSIKPQVEATTWRLLQLWDETRKLGLQKRSLERLKFEYLRGKVVMIDAKTGRVHRMHRDLTDSVRASLPDQVGTIVLLKCGEEKVGVYTRPGAPLGAEGPGAYRRSCKVTVIDRLIPVAVGSSRTFDGSAPPTQSTGPAYGSWPTADILAYLDSLPRIRLDVGPNETEDEWILEAGLGEVVIDIPPLDWTDIKPEAPIVIWLPDSRRPIEMLPNGTAFRNADKYDVLTNIVTRNREHVPTLGKFPASQLVIKARDPGSAPIRVTLSVPARWPPVQP